jgi:aryl-alcohol dehydrogenase-like predicted oxidoreductase
MNQTILQQAGLQLSSLALGCEPLGGTDWGTTDIAQLQAAVRCAWDNGIKVFDTADVYGLGRSESELSKALGAQRHDAVIVTKFGVRWFEPKDGERADVVKDNSVKYLQSALEASLKRLRVEAIPIYLIHWPDGITPVEETIEALEQCRKAGKIISYGLSNFEWQGCQSVVQEYPVAVFEGKYNLLEQTDGNSLFRKLSDAGVAILSYGPLAQGLLTGKYNKNTHFSQDDRRHRIPLFCKDAWRRNTRVLDVLRNAAQHYDCTLAQVALRWIIEQEIVTSIVVGAKNPAQVEGNLGALCWQMDEYWMAELAAAAEP